VYSYVFVYQKLDSFLFILVLSACFHSLCVLACFVVAASILTGFSLLVVYYMHNRAVASKVGFGTIVCFSLGCIPFLAATQVRNTATVQHVCVFFLLLKLCT
jgi:hypothetical protein